MYVECDFLSFEVVPNTIFKFKFSNNFSEKCNTNHCNQISINTKYRELYLYLQEAQNATFQIRYKNITKILKTPYMLKLRRTSRSYKRNITLCLFSMAEDIEILNVIQRFYKLQIKIARSASGISHSYFIKRVRHPIVFCPRSEIKLTAVHNFWIRF